MKRLYSMCSFIHSSVSDVRSEVSQSFSHQCFEAHQNRLHFLYAQYNLCISFDFEVKYCTLFSEIHVNSSSELIKVPNLKEKILKILK